MSDSADLLSQIANGDYQASSQTLLHMATNYPPTTMRDSLQRISDELRERVLMLRDHVTHFLGLTPLYFALQLSSQEMMLMICGARSSIEARSRVLTDLIQRIADTPSVLDSSRVDLVKLATSECVVILPDVLRTRADQMRLVSVRSNIPEGVSPGPHQILIDRLWQTAYGRMILRAIEIPSRTEIVGSREWSKIGRALSEAGFHADEMFCQLPYVEWLEELKSVRAGTTGQKSESTELGLLDALFWASEEIGYSSDKVALAALEVVARSGSRVADAELKARAVTGNPKVREKALETLVECSGPDAVEFLCSLLENKQDPVRSKVAEALSSITSRNFTSAAELTVRGAALAAKEIPTVSHEFSISRAFLDSLRTLLGHSSSLVRGEGSKVLLSLDPGARSRVMDELSTDRSTAVRFEVLSLVDSLPDDDARTIIVRGMKDESLRVRKLAASKGNQLEQQ